MKTLKIEPLGWPCTLEECPPGFFICAQSLCFKTEYKTEKGLPEAYCESGECFIGGTSSADEFKNLIVQPCEARWYVEDLD